jgi:hypothetical protein
MQWLREKFLWEITSNLSFQICDMCMIIVVSSHFHLELFHHLWTFERPLGVRDLWTTLGETLGYLELHPFHMASSSSNAESLDIPHPSIFPQLAIFVMHIQMWPFTMGPLCSQNQVQLAQGSMQGRHHVCGLSSCFDDCLQILWLYLGVQCMPFSSHFQWLTFGYMMTIPSTWKVPIVRPWVAFPLILHVHRETPVLQAWPAFFTAPPIESLVQGSGPAEMSKVSPSNPEFLSISYVCLSYLSLAKAPFPAPDSAG